MLPLTENVENAKNYSEISAVFARKISYHVGVDELKNVLMTNDFFFSQTTEPKLVMSTLGEI